MPNSCPSQPATSTAQATVLTAPRTFSTRQLTLEPAPGQALVRVLETGLCGSDVAMYLGIHPVNRPPLTLGHEFHGELLNTPNGSETSAGQPVAVFPALSCGECAACLGGSTNLCPSMGIYGAQQPGALAGLVAVPAQSIRVIDPATAPTLRVFIEPLAVALHAVDKAGPVSGRRCAVLGAGTIGTLVALVLRHLGAEAVHVVDTNERRLDTIELLDAGFPHRGGNSPLSSVLSTAHGTLDVVLDCVGSAELANQAVGAVRPGGTVVLVGVQRRTLELDGVALQRGERGVVGVQLYTMTDFEQAMRWLAREPRFRDLPSDRLIRRNSVSEVPFVFDRLARGASEHLKETIVFD